MSGAQCWHTVVSCIHPSLDFAVWIGFGRVSLVNAELSLNSSSKKMGKLTYFDNLFYLLLSSVQLLAVSQNINREIYCRFCVINPAEF